MPKTEMIEVIVIDSDRYGVATEFASLDEAQAALRTCRGDFAATTLRECGSVIRDEGNHAVGRIVYRSAEPKIRQFYAAQEPRGFANETTVHEFSSRTERNAWVDEHEDDANGQANTRRITASLAHLYLHGRAYRDDHNTLVTADERNA